MIEGTSALLQQRVPSAIAQRKKALSESPRLTRPRKRRRVDTASLRVEIAQVVHAPAPARVTCNEWSERVRNATTADEITALLKPAASKSTAIDKENLRRAIDERYDLLTHEMGFATHGLRRFAAIGGIGMSAVGLALTLSGLHLGSLAFVIGGGVLSFFMLLGLVRYSISAILLRTTERGKATQKAHLLVLAALEAALNEVKASPEALAKMSKDQRARVEALDRTLLKTIKRSSDVLKGNVSFVALELLRGTIIGPCVDFVADIKGTWRRSALVQETRDALLGAYAFLKSRMSLTKQA